MDTRTAWERTTQLTHGQEWLYPADKHNSKTRFRLCVNAVCQQCKACHSCKTLIMKINDQVACDNNHYAINDIFNVPPLHIISTRCCFGSPFRMESSVKCYQLIKSLMLNIGGELGKDRLHVCQAGGTNELNISDIPTVLQWERSPSVSHG